MPFNEDLVNKIRELLADQIQVEEKRMFQGLCFMVNDKLCLCVMHDNILCRVGEEIASLELEKGNCVQMMHSGRPMKNYVYVEDVSLQSSGELLYWVKLCLDFNVYAKSSKRKR